MPGHEKVVLVDWALGNRCNHACSYCPSELHDGTLPWQDARAVRALFRQLRRHYADGLGMEVWVQFTGGEPTLHPRITELLEDAAGQGLRTSLISNGSRTLRFWEGVADRLDSVLLTYHDEFCDHDHFLEVAELLDERMPVHVNVAVHPDRFDRVLERAREIGQRVPNASIALKPLRKGFGAELYEYSEAQRAALETRVTRTERADRTIPRSVMVREFASGGWDVIRPNALILAGENRWRGYICSAGIESLRVRPDGSVTRAVCVVGGVIGRLGGPLDLPATPIACARERCACVADILITKRRPRGVGEPRTR